MASFIIHPGSHQKRLSALIASRTGPIRIPSPYVSGMQLVPETRARDVRLLTEASIWSVASRSVSLETLRSLIGSGAKCRDLAGTTEPMLHAKVYIFGRDRAVITSANFTTNGWSSNNEAGVELADDQVMELIPWFDRLWNKATRLDNARLDELDAKTAALSRQLKFLRECAEAADALRLRSGSAARIDHLPRC
jgi:phosphatidylserine/phosphatidylglycerophosphate/cardiolipin synthase-like enzyme